MSLAAGIAIPHLATVSLSGTALPEHLDEGMWRFYQETDGSILFLKFADALFIDIATLNNCIALLVAREEHNGGSNLQSYIVYPRSRAVRDFLALWRFPEAVEQATGKPFAKFLVPQDHEYLDEPQITYKGVGTGLDALEFDPDWQQNAGGQRNFFEFVTFADKARSPIVPLGPLALVPRNETSRWGRPLIEQVLSRHFGGSSSKSEIPRVVVFEAMSNAVRHPRARLIQVVSRFYRAKLGDDPSSDPHDPVPGSLRICIWDDGETIAQTLVKPLREGKRIRAAVLPAYLYERVYVDIRLFDDRFVKYEIVDQADDIVEGHATEARMLMASLFPGVSRSLAEDVPQVPLPEDPHTVQGSAIATSPGMGLYSLTRIVVDQFQGALIIRSGQYRLRLETADDATREKFGVRYYCKINQYPDPKVFPPFRGNLICIQLPTRPGGAT